MDSQQVIEPADSFIKEGGDSRAQRSFWQGVKTISPLIPGVFPFAVITGASAIELGLSNLAALGLSILVFAGASQLVFLEMLALASPMMVLVATVLIVNLRFSMYSATIAPYFKHLSGRWKAFLAYLLTDQAFLMSMQRFQRDGQPAGNKWFYLGAGSTLWIVWQLGLLTGIHLGRALPESWSLDFAVPLSFLALLVPALVSRGTVLAALTSGVVVLFSRHLPYNLGLIAAVIAGLTVGMIWERRQK